MSIDLAGIDNTDAMSMVSMAESHLSFVSAASTTTGKKKRSLKHAISKKIVQPLKRLIGASTGSSKPGPEGAVPAPAGSTANNARGV